MNVIVALSSEMQMTLQCNPYETVHDVLQRIINYFQLQYSNICLVYLGKKLNENDQIGNLNYTHDSKIYVYLDNQRQYNNQIVTNYQLLNEQRFFQVTFSLISGASTTIKCKPNETLKDHLSTIQKNLQLNCSNKITLIYNGKFLNIEEKIENINYKNSQVIIVNTNIR